MAFIDNSGSIILDCVLTDTGRMLLARGDGSFKVAKYAFFDDEINYCNYNSSHSSGSSYYDLTIMSSPILEAFTNNMSYGRSKLMTITRTNLLYLPVIKLNEVAGGTATHSTYHSFVVAVDEDTEEEITGLNGVLFGEHPASLGNHIRVDQGLDTDEISAALPIDPDLVETQYIVEMDNRLGFLVDVIGSKRAAVSYVDDDYKASYFFSLGGDGNFVEENGSSVVDDPSQVIRGPRGTILKFKIRSSLEVNTSDYLFNLLGSNDETYNYIDTNIRITGGTTGYTLDVPVRYLKKI